MACDDGCGLGLTVQCCGSDTKDALLQLVLSAGGRKTFRGSERRVGLRGPHQRAGSFGNRMRRLNRSLKKSSSERFASGHDFSRADKPFILSSRAGFCPARDLFFDFFSDL